jgi:hypothetical protein
MSKRGPSALRVLYLPLRLSVQTRVTGLSRVTTKGKDTDGSWGQGPRHSRMKAAAEFNCGWRDQFGPLTLAGAPRRRSNTPSTPASER